MARKINTEIFIREARELHKDEYQYPRAVYVKASLKLRVTCRHHGDFYITPNHHLNKVRKTGCPVCGYIKQGVRRRERLKKERGFYEINQPREYKLIPLGKNKFAKVSNEDFERVAAYNWYETLGYANSNLVGLMHRFILEAGEEHVDHIDHDTLDNRRENLRLCQNIQNSKNRKVRPMEGTSIFKGVCLDKRRNRWVAQITADYVRHYIGCFGNPEDAAKAYDKKAKELHGNYNNCNFIYDDKDNIIGVNKELEPYYTY